VEVVLVSLDQQIKETLEGRLHSQVLRRSAAAAVKVRTHLVSRVDPEVAAVKILAILAAHQIQPARVLNQVSRNLQIAQITVIRVPSEGITAYSVAAVVAEQVV
jgi:hypothetical protein